jgi:hypothetical protein
MKCITAEGKSKRKYTSFREAKELTNKINERNKNNNYLYNPLMAYKCNECNYFHIGRIKSMKKGKKSLTLKVLGFIPLIKKSNNRTNIIINISKDRFIHIKREVKNNKRWNLTINFKLGKSPNQLSENCKVYISNKGIIKGYLKLLRIENNKLVCRSIFYKENFNL